MSQEQLVLFTVRPSAVSPPKSKARRPGGAAQPGKPPAPKAARPAPLPPTLDVMQAAGLMGIGRTIAYRLIRQGRWPTQIVHVGRKIKIPTVPLLEYLGLPVQVDGLPVSTDLADSTSRHGPFPADSPA
jgi:hypothetical protein